jgi:hypothetical protein
MHTDWRCDDCGPAHPLHVPIHIGADVMKAVIAELTRGADPVPLWCPWPLPSGWTVTGAGWVGDDRDGAHASVLACSGPAPLSGGPADLVLVAESLGVGLASRYAGMRGPDPGPALADAMAGQPAHAKIRAGGHPTPMWSVNSPEDRSAYVGEASARWLVAVAWPATAGYLLADNLVLQDLTDWLPPEIVYGAPSPYLHGSTETGHN